MTRFIQLLIHYPELDTSPTEVLINTADIIWVRPEGDVHCKLRVASDILHCLTPFTGVKAMLQELDRIINYPDKL